MKLKPLTPEEKYIIEDKGTEPPRSGRYDDFYAEGTYTCKRCGVPLYYSKNKFNAHCGWPSFDDEIPGAVKRSLDADGIRTQTSCAKCGAHLGHVFTGENLTSKNVRHCVNSLSLDFMPSKDLEQNARGDRAYFAGGCFWGVEYFFKKAEGTISTRAGYMGGAKPNPTYKEVCSGTTGHLETVEIIYDPKKTSFEKLAKLFFGIHDPTQVNGQGPDIGEQYQSAIFYTEENQKTTAEHLIVALKKKGYEVATKLIRADVFWPAEEYHQDYYTKISKAPYCHIYTKRF